MVSLCLRVVHIKEHNEQEWGVVNPDKATLPTQEAVNRKGVKTMEKASSGQSPTSRWWWESEEWTR